MNVQVRKEAKAHWDAIAKPIASLGLMEEYITKIAGIQGTADPNCLDISRRALLIFCGDHGVVCEGVTQTGQEVTRQVAENFAAGKSTVNILAKRANCDVYTVDIGMASSEPGGQRVVKSLPYGCTECRDDIPVSMRIIDRKIEFGTGNLAVEPAMSVSDCRHALTVGKDLVRELKDRGYQMIATGEMGIGNTTASAALASVFLKESPERTVGRGAGLSDEGILRKQKVVSAALERIQKKGLTDPVELLAEVGGYEIAGMAGAFLGGAECGVPIIIDGVISAAACLAAAVIDPRVPDYAIASHSSGERTEELILKRLGVHPIIDGKLCLGEGSGCMVLLPILDMAMDVYRSMGSFEDFSIASYHRFGNEPDREQQYD